MKSSYVYRKSKSTDKKIVYYNKKKKNGNNNENSANNINNTKNPNNLKKLDLFLKGEYKLDLNKDIKNDYIDLLTISEIKIIKQEKEKKIIQQNSLAYEENSIHISPKTKTSPINANTRISKNNVESFNNKDNISYANRTTIF